MIREQAVQFGKNASLTGVLTLPHSTTEDRPAFIMLNPGILHRIGPCRLHVRVARAVAEAGFPALRLDFSGIGDSEPRRDSLAFEESAPLEVCEAMDYLSTKGMSRFVLLGLCSGADMAHLAARQDERVRGLVLLDPWVYRTRMHLVHYYAQRVFRLAVWKRWFLTRVNVLANMTSKSVIASPESDEVDYEVPKYVRHFPPHSTVAADLKSFAARKVRLLAMFTSGQEDIYNHVGQYRSSFSDVPLGELLEEHFLANATHIITGLEHQQYVVESVMNWSLAHFAAEAPAAARPSPASTANVTDRETVRVSG